MPLNHRHAAANAKGFGRHLQSRRGLPPFIFIEIDQTDDAVDGLFILTVLDDFCRRAPFANLRLHPAHVGWQQTLIGLIQAQFR